MPGRALVVVAMMFASAACAPKIEKRVPGTGMLVGSWSIQNGYRDLKAMELHSWYAPPFKPVPVAFIDEQGHFAFSNLPPGKYRLMEFSVGYVIGGERYSLAPSLLSYLTGNEEPAFDFEVRADQVTFSGSWAVTDSERYLFGGGEFKVEPRANPDRREVLSALLSSAKDTGWDELICRDLGAECQKPRPMTARHIGPLRLELPRSAAR